MGSFKKAIHRNAVRSVWHDVWRVRLKVQSKSTAADIQATLGALPHHTPRCQPQEVLSLQRMSLEAQRAFRMVEKTSSSNIPAMRRPTLSKSTLDSDSIRHRRSSTPGLDTVDPGLRTIGLQPSKRSGKPRRRREQDSVMCLGHTSRFCCRSLISGSIQTRRVRGEISCSLEFVRRCVEVDTESY